MSLFCSCLSWSRLVVWSLSSRLVIWFLSSALSRSVSLIWSLLFVSSLVCRLSSGHSSYQVSRLLWSFSRPFSLISILLSLAGREICLFIFLQCCVSIGVSVHLSCFCLSVCMCTIRTILLILVQSSAHWAICLMEIQAPPLSKNPGPGFGASGTPPKALNFRIRKYTKRTF